MARKKNTEDTATKRPRGRPRNPPPAEGSKIGGNGGKDNGLTDVELQALFLNGLKRLEVLNIEMDRIKSEVRNQRKRMKSDGFERYEVDYALALRKREENEMVDQRRREHRIARWLAHPAGTQADMFAEVSSAPKTNGSTNPQELGKIAGAEGAVCKPPLNLNQDDAQRWITGWQEGQKAMAGAGIKAPAQQPDF